MLDAAARLLGVRKFLAGNSLVVDDPEAVSAHMMAAHKLGRAAIKAARGDLPVGGNTYVTHVTATIHLTSIDPDRAGSAIVSALKRYERRNGSSV